MQEDTEVAEAKEATSAAVLSYVATAKPGMHDKHAWWRAAASALAAHFTSSHFHSPASYELAEDGVVTGGMDKEYGTGAVQVETFPASDHVRDKMKAGLQQDVGYIALQEHVDSSQHDVALVLQRALIVAMVRSLCLLYLCSLITTR
jgi:hypothetical protein